MAERSRRSVVMWVLVRCERALAALVTCAYGALVMVHAEALRAAGVNGTAPPNAAAITQFVSAITDNALWVIGTIVGLAIVVVGCLFMVGHSRAQDYAAKIGLGALILVSAPGLAA